MFSGPGLPWGRFCCWKALPHIFSVTAYRHGVVLPSLLYLTQTLVQCPIRNHGDLVTGVLIAGLVVEYTREAHRVSPEVLAFLAGVLRLFVVPNKWNECAKTNPIPSLANVVNYPDLLTLRDGLVSNKKGYSSENPPKLSLELKRNASTNLEKLDSAKVAAGVFCATLHMIDTLMDTFRGKVDHSENELFSEIAQSLLCLGEDIAPKSKTNTPSKKKKKMSILPSYLSERLSSTVHKMTKITGQTHRAPLLRRLPPPTQSIKTLAPRMADPTKYSLSNDARQSKSQSQAESDRLRREYKREHKAVSRELRLDGQFVEMERRKELEYKTGKDRKKRNENFAWLEGEQAAMNQQVRIGGGLLKGGGIGMARAKAATAQLGIKKGGKMS